MSDLHRRILRRAHHLRHRPLDQLYWRVRFALARPRPDPRPAPPRRLPLADAWCPPAQRYQGLIGPCRFRFLNTEHEVATPATWNDPTLGRRWLYDLHNFHYLTAHEWPLGLQWHASLISRWIEDHPPVTGIGWEPYPLSLRIVNWIKWTLAGNRLAEVALHSLAIQARFLCRRLERHIPGNHLLANGKALVFAGLFFEGAEAERWLDSGVRLLTHELRRQILADGGQCERSPMYHGIVLEDCLDLLNLTRAYGHESRHPWLEVLPPLRRWLRVLCHPDGEIASFNDAAIGIAAAPDELEAYAVRLGLAPCDEPHGALVHLADSGFVRLTRGPAVALLDIGPIGPDFLAGHGHAGTCTFELSLQGHRVVVDSGISRYDRSAERLRQRGTAAHNTVVVDGLNSSDVWDDFKVGRRARVSDVRVSDTPHSSRVTATHDGYRRRGAVGHHRRSWEMSEKGLTVTDEIEGSGHHRLEVIFHFHPDVGVHELGLGSCELVSASGQRLATLQLDSRLQPRVQESTYHPQFGVSLRNQQIIGQWSGQLPVRVVSAFLSQQAVAGSP